MSIDQLEALKRDFIYNMIHSSKKEFHAFIFFTIKYLTNTDVPARVAPFFLRSHQYFEVERPKGQYLEVVVHP